MVTKIDFAHLWTTKMNQGHSNRPMVIEINFGCFNVCLGFRMVTKKHFDCLEM
jgi:hypothetical protein